MKNQLVAFYTSLFSLIQTAEFNVNAARKAFVDSGHLNLHLTRKDFCVEFLEEAHTEYHDSSRDLDIMEELAEECFQDLSSFMEDEEVKSIFHDFQRLSGTGTDQDLFTHISEVVDLGDGAARVTITVDSLEKFKDFLGSSGDGDVEVVHLTSVEDAD